MCSHIGMPVQFGEGCAMGKEAATTGVDASTRGEATVVANATMMLKPGSAPA
jgi:hypothetical protein